MAAHCHALELLVLLERDHISTVVFGLLSHVCLRRCLLVHHRGMSRLQLVSHVLGVVHDQRLVLNELLTNLRISLDKLLLWSWGRLGLDVLGCASHRSRVQMDGDVSDLGLLSCVHNFLHLSVLSHCNLRVGVNQP